MKKRLFYAMMATMMSLSMLFASCEEDDNEPENQDDTTQQQNDNKTPLVDENENAAVIKVMVFDYKQEIKPITDENGEQMYDDDGEPMYDTCQLLNDWVGKTVYMFDTDNFTDKTTAVKKVITDASSSAIFELSEDFFSKDSNPAFFFAIYDSDGKNIGHGGMNIKKGKESWIIIDTQGETSGAFNTSNLVKQYKLQEVVQENKFTVRNRNSGHRIKVALPENTVSWYFSFNCVEIDGNNGILGLFSELGKYLDPTKGLVSGVIDKLTKPTGTAECNIYLVDECENKFPVRQGFQAGIVDETQQVMGTYYLEFEKPSFWSNGISVNLEVVALTCE